MSGAEQRAQPVCLCARNVICRVYEENFSLHVWVYSEKQPIACCAISHRSIAIVRGN